MNKSEAGARSGVPQAGAGTARNAPNHMDERTQAADLDSLFAPNTANPSQRFQSEISRPSTGDGHPSNPTNEDTQHSAPGTMPAVGTRVQHYELIRQLGSGGMGTVYLAR